jgi:4-amino-4-deoxy-L-arabinose transferase-like glycosyltransferase
MEGTRTEPATWVLCAVLGVVAIAVFAIRLTGFPNLLDNEYRLGATVLNVLRDGNWVCPHDSLGNTDKPPLLTWLAALASLPSGRVSLLTLHLPTALATIALSWIILAVGRRRFGWRTGALGGLAYLLSDVGAKQMATARWDGLFALTVTVAALAAFEAWMRGTGWLWFWLAAAASTLTKGPLGVLLGGLGLCASVWERRAGTPKPVRGAHLDGILAFLAITLGWFLLAYRAVGWPLVQNMVGKELVGHIVEHEPGRRFFKPIGNLLTNFAPWSAFMLLAFWRIVRSPAPGDIDRRFERFLFCWCVGGLLLFSISPHNEARLLWPLMPPAALLAGRELARLTVRTSDATLGLGCLAATAIVCAVFVVQYHVREGRSPEVQETLAIQRLARVVEAQIGEDPPLAYVDTPYAFQLALNALQPPTPFPVAAAGLSSGAPYMVAVVDIDQLVRAMGPGAAGLNELAHGTLAGRPYIHVVSNRPANPTPAS